MLFINKPNEPRKLVKFYAQLTTEFKNCEIDMKRMEGYTLTLFDETLLHKDGREPSLNLLRELDLIQRSNEVKQEIGMAIKKILRRQLLKRVSYFAHVNKCTYEKL